MDTYLMVFDLFGDYALDNRRRIARRFATWEHAEEVLRYFEKFNDDDNYQALEEEVKALAKYWNVSGATKETAVAGYYADHPDEATRAFLDRQDYVRAHVRQLQADLDYLNERRADKGLPPVELDLSFGS
jgi:hypothetical protein